MLSIWKPCGYHVDTMWLPHGFQVDTIWFLCRYHVVPTKVEVDIIVKIVVFKKLKSVSEERGRKSKGRAVIFVASLKKKEIKEKK